MQRIEEQKKLALWLELVECWCEYIGDGSERCVCGHDANTGHSWDTPLWVHINKNNPDLLSDKGTFMILGRLVEKGYYFEVYNIYSRSKDAIKYGCRLAHGRDLIGTRVYGRLDTPQEAVFNVALKLMEARG